MCITWFFFFLTEIFHSHIDRRTHTSERSSLIFVRPTVVKDKKKEKNISFI
jgi:hypothetical protein